MLVRLLALLVLFPLSRAFHPARRTHLSVSSLLRISRSSTAATVASSLIICKAAASASTATATATTEMSTAYKSLLGKLETITHLNRAKSVLEYDQLVFMPKAASEGRGAQLSALAALIHEKTTDPTLRELIEQSTKDLAEDNMCSDDEQNWAPDDAKRLLELELKTLEQNERISTELAAKAASLSSSAYAAWVEARQKDDFASFSPVLKDCFETSMALAEAKRGDKDISLYTQMLDEFEMGMSQERIDQIFGETQTALVPLIKKVLESPKKPSTEALRGEFDIDVQKQVSEELVSKLGFDTERGRIDVSAHPFTSGMGSKDVRVTSRYRTDEWYQGLAGMIHEGGHAMYEQSLGDTATSLDTALSMGTHESQSLFWERHVGLSKPFWKFATATLKSKFPDKFGDKTPEDIYGAVNAVSPSLIRVEADELTYPLHVILRYNIEKDVIGGQLEVDEIPARWKTEMKSLLDVDVPNDTLGCLQDVHWSALAFGYFPTYLIGSATAAQLAHYCRKDLDIDTMMKNGEFHEIKEWLTNKIHRHGKRYPSLDSLLESQVGEQLNPRYFIDYLTEKYSELYGLE